MLGDERRKLYDCGGERGNPTDERTMSNQARVNRCELVMGKQIRLGMGVTPPATGENHTKNEVAACLFDNHH